MDDNNVSKEFSVSEQKKKHKTNNEIDINLNVLEDIIVHLISYFQTNNFRTNKMQISIAL